ncbi:MAG TPA: MerR family transcriptional regulator [Candidatus Atribacteria bacterium]|nr:MerR family transcriptional regulator [Candidatus Atribacteria bacterium]
MTIKEVEQRLGIPRASIRYYEKEGLIEPHREENGYRDYSQEDVVQLKKIIILRKIGLSINDISDILKGAKTMPETLRENIVSLQRRIDELSGAMYLCSRMIEDEVEIDSFDTDKYWDMIDEEERKGHSFIDLAKDIVRMEKGIAAGWFSWTSADGESYDSLPKIILNVVVAVAITGCIICMARRTWDIRNFFSGIIVIISVLLVEAVLSVPLYLLGKKYVWIRKNRNKALVIACIVTCVVLLIFNNIM